MARRVSAAEAFESEMVGINAALISRKDVRFGGVKQSELWGGGSRHGLNKYTELKLSALVRSMRPSPTSPDTGRHPI